MSSTANDFLMGGGVTSAKFPTIGTTVSGRITRINDPMQQRDFATGTPKTWDDGSPMMQLPIELATDQRDPDVGDDDGSRMVYIKGTLQKSLREAIRAAGAKGIEVGGTLTITYARDGVAKQRGFNPPKEYDVTYAAPAAQAANAFLGVNTATGEVPAQAPAAPAAAAPAGVDPAVAAALSALSPEQRAAMGLPAA